MGQSVQPLPVKLFVGMLSGEAANLEETEGTLVERFGPVDVRSELLPFRYTDYYTASMGPDLLRRLIGFEKLISPGDLAAIKLFTNDLEGHFAAHPEPRRRVARPVNLDPGYLSPAKVVLATTKDYSHRIYLDSGIYAEVTLHFHKGQYEPWPWTYPDYRTEEYQKFFQEMRRDLLARSKENQGP